MALSDKFENGETVVCSITVKTNSTSALIDPATSMTVRITNPVGTVTISTTAMINDGVGLDHYDYTPVGGVLGAYQVRYTATDGTRITIQDDYFTLIS